MADKIESPGMLADRLRPLVTATRGPDGYPTSCLNGTPMVPIHIATLTTIWNVLENAARAMGERP